MAERQTSNREKADMVVAYMGCVGTVYAVSAVWCDSVKELVVLG
jgi:hypothetical protein